MKKISKSMCILLTAVMLLSFLPIVSSAQGEADKILFDTIVNGNTVILNVFLTEDSASVSDYRITVSVPAEDFICNACAYQDTFKSFNDTWFSKAKYEYGADGRIYFRIFSERNNYPSETTDLYPADLGKFSFGITKENCPLTFDCTVEYRSSANADYTSVSKEYTVQTDKASAEQTRHFGCGKGMYWTFADGVLTVSGNGEMRRNNYAGITPWMQIADDITEIVIENGITFIGDYAFQNCINATKITIPSTVKRIGKGAFTYAESIQELTLPEGLIGIEAGAFAGEIMLKTVKIPSTVTWIDSHAFAGCDSFETFTFGENTEYVGINAVSGKNLKEINFPANVRYIEMMGFGQPSGGPDEVKLTAVNVAEGNKHYKSVDGVLYTKTDKEIIYISPLGGEFYIKPKTLLYCPPEKTGYVVIEEGTVSIGDDAFDNNILELVFVPDSVVNIDLGFLGQFNTRGNCIMVCNPGSYAHKYALDCGITYTFPEFVKILGDANGDGKLTTNDAKATLRHVAGLDILTGDRLTLADFNGDGKVTTNDAKKMLRVIAGLE